MSNDLPPSKRSYLESKNYSIAMGHKHNCKCDFCLQWWIRIGIQGNAANRIHSPFTEEELQVGKGINFELLF